MDAVDDPPLRTCIRCDPDRRVLERASLVLSSVDIDHDIEPAAAHWCLWVPDALVQRAVAELETYSDENRPRQTPQPRVITIDNGWIGVICYLLVIWLLPSLEASATFGWHWRSIGALDAGRVMDGQWWRTVTALTLHANLGHLMSNSLFGAVFGVFVGRHLGSGLGWLLVLVCGALGNTLDAALQAADFQAIGASTATFGSIGLVGAFVWRRGYYRTLDWRRSVAPLFAGIALLAFLGIEGENIDVVGHLAGFVVGVACGVAVAPIDVTRLGTAAQILCGFAAIAVVACAWSLAGFACC